MRGEEPADRSDMIQLPDRGDYATDTARVVTYEQRLPPADDTAFTYLRQFERHPDIGDALLAFPDGVSYDGRDVVKAHVTPEDVAAYLEEQPTDPDAIIAPKMPDADEIAGILDALADISAVTREDSDTYRISDLSGDDIAAIRQAVYNAYTPHAGENRYNTDPASDNFRR